MNYARFFDDLANVVDPSNIKLNEPLSKHTTVRIGGPADIFFTPRTREELLAGIAKCRELQIPVTMLGWGANTLISDKGIRGVVIRSLAKGIQIDTEEQSISTSKPNSKLQEDDNLAPRWDAFGDETVKKLYEFKDLDYSESDLPRTSVRMDAGVDLPFAINFTISNGLTGLQWYSRIPGTIGGSVFNNIHGGTHYISEVVQGVEVLSQTGDIFNLTKDQLEFEYDYSRFHHSGEIILSVEFSLYRGDADKAKYVAMEWAKRKAIQPSNSLGCVFRNLSNEEKDKFGFPTTSFGYVVEHVLKLSDFRIGDAMVSPRHKAFIENVGNASAADYLAVMKEIQRRTKAELGIDIEPEIFLMGF